MIRLELAVEPLTRTVFVTLTFHAFQLHTHTHAGKRGEEEVGEKKDEALANVPKSNANILLLTLIVDVDAGWLHGSHYGRIICPAAKMFYYQTNVLHDFAFSLPLSLSLSISFLFLSLCVLCNLHQLAAHLLDALPDTRRRHLTEFE